MALTLVVTGLLGFWAGRVSAPAPAGDEALRELVLAHEAQLTALRARPPPSTLQGPCSTVATLSATDSEAIRSELARLVQEALRTEAKAPSAEPEPDKPRPEEPDPTRLAMSQDAQHLVDKALSARRWTEHDAQSFRMLAPNLPESHRQALMRQLAMAVNEGRLQLDTRGPPF